MKAKQSKEDFKALFQELDKARDTLQRCGDLYLERRGAHIAAGEAVMWISVTRAKAIQIFEEQYPDVSRAEYYKITGRKGVF